LLGASPRFAQSGQNRSSADDQRMTLADLKALRRYAPESAKFWADTAGTNPSYELRLSPRDLESKTRTFVMFIYIDDTIATVTDRFRRLCREFEEENK
jgi:hypothetical protein